MKLINFGASLSIAKTMHMQNEKILNSLPRVFTRQQLLAEVSQRGFSISKAAYFIESHVYSGKLKRVSRGVYRQTAVPHD